MSLTIYAVGDALVLRAGLTRTAVGIRTCRVVGVLPNADRGEQQYRVRFGNENFERRIVGSDIDRTETAANEQTAVIELENEGGPWLKPMRIGK
ncbi:cold-shock protein [Neorhizobium lilium]|uniref:Cold-shock protein n=1 Tax=Neorhizobium lilium TaxID=2503024 RepID=A0A444LF12_9HYPH|nr:cold-shock protein [Neorhizobium lilium]RWX76691.1 cold-shock protein [Neorhizobium lilium]